MKKLLFGLFALWSISLFASTAYAKTVKLKAFSGRIHNHSRFLSNQIELKIKIYCEYFISTNRRGTCGSKSVRATIAQDGTYEIPELSLTSQGTLFPYFSFYYDLSINSGAKKLTPQESHNKPLSFGESDAQNFISYMRDLTIFNIQKSLIQYQTPNMSFAEWMILNRSGDFYKSWLGMNIDLNLGKEQFHIQKSISNPVPNKIYIDESILLISGKYPMNQRFLIEARSTTLPERTLHFSGSWSFENLTYPEEILNPVIGPESN